MSPGQEALPVQPAPPAPELPPIVQVGASVLREPVRDVPPEMFGTPELDVLIETMIATMRAAPGVGLAAPQIGVPLRIIVLEDRPELVQQLTELEVSERERVAFSPRVFINPELVPVGDETATFFEGCLSVAGFVGLVTRHAEVTVRGLDAAGQPQTWQVRGWPARILQHEVDHLGGRLYIDRMHTRSFSTSRHAKARFGGKPIAEIRRALGL